MTINQHEAASWFSAALPKPEPVVIDCKVQRRAMTVCPEAQPGSYAHLWELQRNVAPFPRCVRCDLLRTGGNAETFDGDPHRALTRTAQWVGQLFPMFWRAHVTQVADLPLWGLGKLVKFTVTDRHDCLVLRMRWERADGDFAQEQIISKAEIGRFKR